MSIMGSKYIYIWKTEGKNYDLDGRYSGCISSEQFPLESSIHELSLCYRELSIGTVCLKSGTTYLSMGNEQGKVLVLDPELTVSSSPSLISTDDMSLSEGPSEHNAELQAPRKKKKTTQVYTGIGSPQLNAANIWDIYCKILQSLHGITTSNSADADQDYIDAVDEWQVLESLQDQDGEHDIVPYPLIEGRELFRENEQNDGSLYLGGVNEGRGLVRHRFIHLSFYFYNNSPS